MRLIVSSSLSCLRLLTSGYVYLLYNSQIFGSEEDGSKIFKYLYVNFMFDFVFVDHINVNKQTKKKKYRRCCAKEANLHFRRSFQNSKRYNSYLDELGLDICTYTVVMQSLRTTSFKKKEKVKCLFPEHKKCLKEGERGGQKDR